MAFSYFRFLVVLLASFGAFFAYACRLNLSMTINEMVVKDEITGTELDLAVETDSHILNNPYISTEEHTLAWFTRSSRRLKVKAKPIETRLESFSTLNINQTFRTALTVDLSPDNAAQDPAKMLSLSTEESEVSITNKSNLLNWSESERNSLLGAFFLGYVASQIPAARAAEIFGAKSLFLVAGFGASFCSLAFPFASKYSTGILYAYIVRIILGLTQGALFPAAYVLLCEWLPRTERSTWLPYPSTFSRIGTIVTSLIVPPIMDSFNWETVFYVSGFATLAWCLLFIVFGSNSPVQSMWISKKELMYIESRMEPRVGTLTKQPSLTASGFTINESFDESLVKPSVSWIKMIFNKAILILTLVMFTSEWSNMLLLIKLPGFLNSVLQMNLQEIGICNSILIAIYCLQYPLSGLCATKLENAGFDSLTSLRIRKIFEALAHIMQGTGCLMIAFSSDKTVILSALGLMMFGRATVGGGQCLMPPELSKDYPGTVFAYANTLANLAGIIGPEAINRLVLHPKEHSSWSILWITSAVIFFVSGLVFCIFAENRPQNYCKKPARKGGNLSMSQAQLTIGKSPVEEIFKMDAFARVASEPVPKAIKVDPRYE